MKTGKLHRDEYNLRVFLLIAVITGSFQKFTHQNIVNFPIKIALRMPLHRD